jgi:hypothetical protein
MATFPVWCECGKTHQVPGSAAGTTIACDCRRNVEVPSFAKLKASVGESSVSIDLLLEQMGRNRELPIETNCVLCFGDTSSTLVANVECERERMSEKTTLVWYEILILPISWLLVVISYFKRQQYSRVIGKDMIFRLPIRVCESCKPELRNPNDIRDALGKSELYRQLLDKYPMARIER